MPIDVILYMAVPVALIILGLVAGQVNEGRHVRELDQREQALKQMLVTDVRTFSADCGHHKPPALMVAEAVIASDYLKTFLAGLRNIFGGEVGSYISLATRARREALVRMMEQAHAQGYDALCNVRMEPADIGGNTARRGVPMVAILASGTAYSRSAGEHPYRQ